MIILDTNALLWWISNSDKLSKRVKKAVEEAEQEKAVYISSISVLEIHNLIKKGRLGLVTLPANWLDQIESLSYVHFVPIDNKIIVQSVSLLNFDHKDPADRIIIATALNLGAKLVTSDRKILDYPHVQSIW